MYKSGLSSPGGGGATAIPINNSLTDKYSTRQLTHQAWDILVGLQIELEAYHKLVSYHRASWGKDIVGPGEVHTHPSIIIISYNAVHYL